MLRGSKHIASILTIVPEAPYLKEGFLPNHVNDIQAISYLKKSHFDNFGNI